MSQHKYRVGQIVRLDPGQTDRLDENRSYKIQALLPAAWGEARYRVKSVLEAVDRVVKESEFGISSCLRPDVWVRAHRA